ncbi:hypothetical protein RRG08_039995 [Elysia crispata]|uniref:Uncharacterized protein n=1 Tax=Elysia crispata TaxID=231223 RepID=A0AAE1DBB8_9GAST|nr:hypothetical protein RRG08_039995 [Elysia crispata]
MVVPSCAECWFQPGWDASDRNLFGLQVYSRRYQTSEAIHPQTRIKLCEVRAWTVTDRMSAPATEVVLGVVPLVLLETHACDRVVPDACRLNSCNDCLYQGSTGAPSHSHHPIWFHYVHKSHSSQHGLKDKERSENNEVFTGQRSGVCHSIV